MRALVTGGSGFIGTNLITVLLDGGHEVLNLDVVGPKVHTHAASWRGVDLMDPARVSSEMMAFRPDLVVHCAARTDTDSDVVGDYEVNYLGSRNVFQAAREASVRRLVHVSTQFVMGPSHRPSHDADYRPHTTYGESKALAEDVLRKEFDDLAWVILRPTNVWGPWHPRYPSQFWSVLKRGLYLHPRGANPIRSYAWVGTVVEQIMSAAQLPDDHRTFYSGDEPIHLLEWVDAFALELAGHRARQVPLPVLRALALGGDLMLRLGMKAPLTSTRLRSMTEDYVVPMKPTFDALGQPSQDWRDGVAVTCAWLSKQP